MKKILRLFLVGAFTALFIAPAMAEVGVVGDLWDDMVDGAKKVTNKAIDVNKKVINKTKEVANEIVDYAKSDQGKRTIAAVATGGGSETIVGTYKVVTADSVGEAFNEARKAATGTLTFGASTAMEETYGYVKQQEQKKAEEQKKAKEASDYEDAKDVESALKVGTNGKSIHVSDIGVKTSVNQIVRVYVPKAEQEARAAEMMDVFYQNYTVADASVSIGGILSMCEAMLNKKVSIEDKDKCQKLKEIVAFSMQFPEVCGKSGGNCDTTFKNTGTQYRDALGLVQMKHWLETGNIGDIYCSGTFYHKNISGAKQDMLRCKVTDGQNFRNYEYEFDDMTESVHDRIIKDVSIAATKLIWGDGVKYVWNDDGPVADRYGERHDVYDNYVMLPGKDETSCKKDEEKVQKFFNGWTKYTKGTPDHFSGTTPAGCVVNFYQTLSAGYLPNDLSEYGVSSKVFQNLNIRNVAELDNLLKNYLIHMVEAHGDPTPKNVRCDMGAGKVNTSGSQRTLFRDLFGDSYDGYIMCHVEMAGGVTKKVAFQFADTCELDTGYAKSQLDGFKCVTREGGTFDGKHCMGLTKEQCSEVSGQIDGGTRWDNELQTCVFNNAEKYANINKGIEVTTKVVGATSALVLSVVAAIPSAGGSLWGVVGAVGTVMTLVGQGMSEHALSEAADKIFPELNQAAVESKNCTEKRGGRDCKKAAERIIKIYVEYDSLIAADTQKNFDTILANVTSYFDDDVYNEMVEDIEANTARSELVETLETGEKLQKWGAIIGIIGFGGGILKNITGGVGSKMVSLMKSGKHGAAFEKVYDKVSQGIKKIQDARGYSNFTSAIKTAKSTKGYQAVSGGKSAVGAFNKVSGGVESGTRKEALKKMGLGAVNNVL